MLNNLVVTFNRPNNFNYQIYPPDYSTLGIPERLQRRWCRSGFFKVNGYFGINSGDTNTFLRNELQIVDTVRWTTARHEIAVGFDYTYGKGDIVNNFRANGRYTFNGSAPFTSDALADFMLGKFQSFEQGVGECRARGRSSLATFIQDTFRVNPNLTLNLGLRWEPFSPTPTSTIAWRAFGPGRSRRCS